VEVQASTLRPLAAARDVEFIMGIKITLVISASPKRTAASAEATFRSWR
jgi:hypothetical protein